MRVGSVVNWTVEQKALLGAPLRAKIFAHGPAGTGKTTAAVERVRRLLQTGVAAGDVLILAPQRTLHEPFRPLQSSLQTGSGTQINLATLGGLARRVCDLFWPLVNEGRFTDASQRPFFLTLESAQYYMGHLVRPLLDQGYFGSVTMDRNRLYSQILDSLNKAAAAGFPHTQIGERLEAAWSGDPAQLQVYADAQECASRFRRFCCQHNLLDFSLQIEVFWEDLWPLEPVRQYLGSMAKHLIYDNAEEDIPRAHDLVRDWMPDLESALVIMDSLGGYRQFLGADPRTAAEIKILCDTDLVFSHTHVAPSPVRSLERAFSLQLAVPHEDPESLSSASSASSDAAVSHLEAVAIISRRFFPELLDAMAAEVEHLVREEGLPAGEIVIVSPYLSDGLRFAIGRRLEARGIPWASHRPSRTLSDEAAAKALMTIAAIGHPRWNERPPRHDVAQAFIVCLGMDLVRARLLTDIVYRRGSLELTAFERINEEKRGRITEAYGALYTTLRDWIVAYREDVPIPLDHFFRRLFGEVLSQSGFEMHSRLDLARIVGMLVESIQKFRLALEPSVVGRDTPDFDLGQEYASALRDGLLPAQYPWAWERRHDEAVLLAPAHSFLLMNRSAAIQYWLEPGSDGWFQRLDQPLTHIRVLSREWAQGRKWTFEDEEHANLAGMYRLVVGLLRRCRQRVVLCVSDLGESGFEQRGRLLTTFQGILQHEVTAE